MKSQKSGTHEQAKLKRFTQNNLRSLPDVDHHFGDAQHLDAQSKKDVPSSDSDQRQANLSQSIRNSDTSSADPKFLSETYTNSLNSVSVHKTPT